MFIPAPVAPWATTASILAGLLGALNRLRGLWGAGLSGATRLALQTMRGVIEESQQAQMRFSWNIARALGWVWKALHTAWIQVIRPMLEQLPRLLGRLRRLIERDLPRLLRLIQRIRERLLEMYERFFRPVLEVIQRMRRILLIFRLLRFRWAERLDAQLRGLQERIMQPLAVVLAHLAEVEQWINVIVSAEQLFQQTIWGRSLYNWQGDFARGWAAAFGRPLNALVAAELWPRAAALTPGQIRAELRLYLLQGTGPNAAAVTRVLAQLRTV